MITPGSEFDCRGGCGQRTANLTGICLGCQSKQRNKLCRNCAEPISSPGAHVVDDAYRPDEVAFTCTPANWHTLFAQERVARERAERQSNGWEDDYNKLIFELRKILGGAPEDEGITETACKVKDARDATQRELVAIWDRCVSVGMSTQPQGLAVGMIMAFVRSLADKLVAANRRIAELEIAVSERNSWE